MQIDRVTKKFGTSIRIDKHIFTFGTELGASLQPNEKGSEAATLLHQRCVQLTLKDMAENKALVKAIADAANRGEVYDGQ